MDIISHALLTNLVYSELPKQTKFFAILMSIFPDFLSFIGVANFNFLKKLLFFKKIPATYFPKYVFTIYNITHSSLVWAIFFIFFYFVLGWTTAGIIISSWGLHILVDIFTHNGDSTLYAKVLWPVSDWHFQGFAWSSRKFLILNYLVFALLYLIFYF